MAFASVPMGDYRVADPDALASVASSSFGRRSFCRYCGTPLTISVDHQPETIDFSLATLDEPQRVTPAFHIFYASRIDWARAADGLPRHGRFRPDTRGLSGTEPPA